MEDRALAATAKVAQYQEQEDGNRWEQCRIAHEAIESGEHSRVSFGEAVGKSGQHIGHQVAVWAKWGEASHGRRPPYPDAYSIVKTTTTSLGSRPTGAQYRYILSRLRSTNTVVAGAGLSEVAGTEDRHLARSVRRLTTFGDALEEVVEDVSDRLARLVESNGAG
jgi:hypothetical protein